MATRVLNTIRDKDRIIGFRVICSLKDNQGSHILTLSQAKVFYKSIEKFENVKYVGNNQWEGLECSLDRVPYMNKWCARCCERSHIVPVGDKLDKSKLVNWNDSQEIETV